MYRIKFTSTASKNFKKLDKRYQKAAVKALDRLASDPRIGEFLKGKLKGLYKLRFSRYRIIYQIKHQTLTVIIFDIRHRRNVYS